MSLSNKQPKFNKAVFNSNGSYKRKYRISPSVMNRYAVNVSNPTVQPDERTEMGIAIPDEMNVEFSKEYQEENKL